MRESENNNKKSEQNDFHDDEGGNIMKIIGFKGAHNNVHSIAN